MLGSWIPAYTLYNNFIDNLVVTTNRNSACSVINAFLQTIQYTCYWYLMLLQCYGWQQNFERHIWKNPLDLTVIIILKLIFLTVALKFIALSHKVYHHKIFVPTALSIYFFIFVCQQVVFVFQILVFSCNLYNILKTNKIPILNLNRYHFLPETYKVNQIKGYVRGVFWIRKL